MRPDAVADTFITHDSEEFVVGGRLVRQDTDDWISIVGRRDWQGGAPESLRVGLRFCRCTAANSNDPQVQFDCEALQPDSTGLCTIGDVLAYENPPDPDWYRITVFHPQGGWEANVDGFDTELGWTSQDYDFQWDLLDDAWALGAPTAPPPFDWAMWGVLWSHVPGEGDGTPFDPATLELTNNYRSRGFGQRYALLIRASTTIPFGPLLVNESICRECVSAFPQPWMMMPPCAGQQGCSQPEARFQTSFSSDITSYFTSGSLNGLGQVAGIWVPASEPYRTLTKTRPRYAAFATNGTTINSFLGMTPSGLARYTPNNPTPRPSSRSQFGRILSSNEGRAWVVGGVNGSGALLQDLWSYDFSTQVWSQKTLTSPARPAKVLAAAYEPFERKLIVLDQYGSTVRLLRIDRDGPTATVLMTWPRTKSNTTFALAVLPAGDGFLIGCSSSASAHAILRIQWTTITPVLTKYKTGTGALSAGQIFADEHGASVLTPGWDGLPGPTGYSLGEFLNANGSTPGLCF